MDEKELKTSPKQRVFIILIAVLMVGSIVASYSAIVISGSQGASSDTTSQVDEAKVAEYQKAMDKKDANLSVESITLTCGVTANKYTGTLPNTEFSGYVVVFKIRDKTAIVQTDSILFEADYNKVLDSITFNA